MRAGDAREGEFKQEHLGDGVYVSCDGYYVWLRCDRDSGVHEVALELNMVDELKTYADTLRAIST